jgi:hypothetical protein
MRDGALLMADVYRPASGEKNQARFPTVLVRTSYDKGNVISQMDPELFVRHGYAVVAQDVRGRYQSEGEFYHGIYEVDDGYDTVEWIAQQPWSDGQIGMTGRSYLAAVQTAAAISNAPHLTSLFHVKAPGNYYQDGYRRGGAFLMYLTNIIFMFAATAQEALDDPVLGQSLLQAYELGGEWLDRWPLKKGRTPLSQVPQYERWLLDMVNHVDCDAFWNDVPMWQSQDYVDQHADVPGYYVGGWYDKYREDTIYRALSSSHKHQPLKLLMGPWTHLDFDCSAGDVDFGPEAAISFTEYNALQLRWFDGTLKGAQNGILEEPLVKIFVMGGGDGRKTPTGKLNHGGRWRFEHEWPLARTQYTPYYLHPDGLLAPGPSAAEEAASTYHYDPRDPVPTIGGSSYFLKGTDPATGQRILFVPYGAHDQREQPEFFGCSTHLPLALRHDVLVFETPPLEQDVEVTGPVQVKLWIQSSAIDTDFTAKLIDVYPPNADYPDGYAMNLTDSILRVRYRDGFEKGKLMEPGRVYEVNIDLPPIANLFQKGHRIRVDVSSSNYPAHDRNPNTGEPYITGAHCVVAENTVYHDKARPSHVLLPIIPAGSP